MFFKNLVIYRLPPDWHPSSADLEARLERHILQPCSPFEMLSRGWVAPSGNGRLVHTVNGHHLIALGANQKLLPSSIIRQEALTRSVELAREQGFPVRRRQMRDLKMRVAEELRARALTRRRVTHGWLDTVGGWCVVDAASAGKAEELIDTLRDSLDSFAVRFVSTLRSPHTSMAAWLSHGDAPGRFAIDQDLELQTADKTKATIRYTRHPLNANEIRAHLAAGKHPTRLGLTWNDRISLLLTATMHVKRVQFLEVAEEASGEGELEAAERFDVDFALMAGELATMLGDLVEVLGGEELPEQRAAAA